MLLLTPLMFHDVHVQQPENSSIEASDPKRGIRVFIDHNLDFVSSLHTGEILIRNQAGRVEQVLTLKSRARGFGSHQ